MEEFNEELRRLLLKRMREIGPQDVDAQLALAELLLRATASTLTLIGLGRADNMKKLIDAAVHDLRMFTDSNAERFRREWGATIAEFEAEPEAASAEQTVH